MGAPLVKTRHPGIYKRNSRYLARYYDAEGKRRAESARTLEEALQIKRAREAARDRGELDLVTQSRVPLREFAEEWVERYQGNGRRGFTDDTRDEYRRDLRRYAFPFFGNRKLGAVGPRAVGEWVAWLCDPEKQGERKAEEARAAGKANAKVEPSLLSDATVRRIMCPVRACFATARQEGVVRSNPCDGVPLPTRPRIEALDAVGRDRKALTRDQLAMFLRIAPREWRTMFRFLAATGLRWSELAALHWADVSLDGSTPTVRVRRALAKKQPKDSPPKFKPPKSKYGVRTIPLDASTVYELREHRKQSEYPEEENLVFAAGNGRPLRQENVRRRVLKVTAAEAGVPWIGFHAFRHTCASLLFDAGRNVKQVQRWLGHHSPGFTLDYYVHLLDDGIGGGLDLAGELEPSGGVTKVCPRPPVKDGVQQDRDPAGTPT